MLMAAIKGDVATLALALSQRSPRLDVDARVPRDSGVQEFEWNVSRSSNMIMIAMTAAGTTLHLLFSTNRKHNDVNKFQFHSFT